MPKVVTLEIIGVTAKGEPRYLFHNPLREGEVVELPLGYSDPYEAEREAELYTLDHSAKHFPGSYGLVCGVTYRDEVYRGVVSLHYGNKEKG